MRISIAKKEFQTALAIHLLALAFAAPAFSGRPDGAGSGASASASSGGTTAASEDDKYDRLDGSGSSGKTVNVIEWEDNLEVHIYPAGSTKGLSLQLDKKNKNKPVMVIGYRFNDQPESQLIRRAILGIPLAEGFKVYRESGNSEYDKFVITNQPRAKLEGNYLLYATETPSGQLYPDGHPALAAAEDPSTPAGRKPAKSGAAAKAEPKAEAKPQTDDDSDGSIGHFFSN